MEKFDYKSKKGNFTDCEIDYLYISTKWDGLLLVATAMPFLLRESLSSDCISLQQWNR